MRRLMLALAFLLGGHAEAQIVPALPFTLQNNTVADATQVMANFNTILNSVNQNAAHNGANSDITSLNGLTTPLSPTQGGTRTWVATGITTGSANAQIIAATTPAVFTLTAGNKVTFFSGFTNPGGPLTLNVNGTGAIPVRRVLPQGPLALGGGELMLNQMTEVLYDGTQFLLLNNWSPGMPGTILDFGAGGILPNGWVYADGSAYSRTTFVALFSVISTNYGPGDGSTTFNVPDMRGRYAAGLDLFGTTRLTVCGSSIGGTCGSQFLSQAQLPATTLTGTFTGTAIGAQVLSLSVGTLLQHNNSSPTATLNFGASMNIVETGTPTVTVPGFTPAGTVSISSFGSSNGFTVPTQLVIKIVKL